MCAVHLQLVNNNTLECLKTHKNKLFSPLYYYAESGTDAGWTCRVSFSLVSI